MDTQTTNNFLSGHSSIILKVAIAVVLLLIIAVTYSWYYLFTLSTSLETAVEDDTSKTDKTTNASTSTPITYTYNYEEKLQILDSIEKNPESLTSEAKRLLLSEVVNAGTEPIINE